jgi:hypothetical protein
MPTRLPVKLLPFGPSAVAFDGYDRLQPLQAGSLADTQPMRPPPLHAHAQGSKTPCQTARGEDQEHCMGAGSRALQAHPRSMAEDMWRALPPIENNKRKSFARKHDLGTA